MAVGADEAVARRQGLDERGRGILHVQQLHRIVVDRRGLALEQLVDERRDERVVVRASMLTEDVRQAYLDVRGAARGGGDGEDLARALLASTIGRAVADLRGTRVDDAHRLVGCAHGAGDVLCEVDVALLDGSVRLRTVDAGQMHDGVGVRDVRLEFAPVLAADGDDVMVGQRVQPCARVPAEKAVRSGDDDLHARASTICWISGRVMSRSTAPSTPSCSVLAEV